MLRIVMVTIPAQNADALVDKLLKERLIACANLISHVKCRYWWKGKLESGEETLVLMKCRAKGLAALEKRIKSLHPYEVPEIVALSVAQVNSSYLKWVLQETKIPAMRKGSSKPKRQAPEGSKGV